MNKTRTFIKRASAGFDANAFITTATEAIAVNPKIWDTQLRAFVDRKIVYAEVGTQTEDFRKPGRDLTVTIDGAPTDAEDLIETDAISIQAMSNRQITYVPTEIGTGFEVSKNELEDSFFDVMPNMVKKVGASLAKRIDAKGVAVAQAGATTIYNVAEAADAALATTSVVDLSEFTKAVRVIKNYDYNPTVAFINPSQEEQILNITQLQKANEFGSRDGIEKGLIGQLFGVKIYVSKSIPTVAAAGDYTVSNATMLFQGETDSEEMAVGFAVKRDATIETDYTARSRKYEVLGTARNDFKVLHPNAIVALTTYAA